MGARTWWILYGFLNCGDGGSVARRAVAGWVRAYLDDLACEHAVGDGVGPRVGPVVALSFGNHRVGLDGVAWLGECQLDGLLSGRPGRGELFRLYEVRSCCKLSASAAPKACAHA